MKPRLYFPDLLTKQAFNYKQSHHLKNVLRLKVGEKILLFDGAGHEVTATITVCDRNNVHFELVEEVKAVDRENKKSVFIAQGLCQSSRMDYVVQKSVELGAEVVAPIITERCQVRHTNNSHLEKKLERWKLIAEHASQQCGRNKLVKIIFPQRFDEFVKTIKQKNSLNLILNPTSNKRLGEIDLSSSRTIVCLIGPEAGFSDSEELLAKKAKLQSVKLGKRILRTETVAVSVLSILNYVSGEF
ncbi:16S rRNA (uracil(1498)-N(3))-methyltransferase [Betaproteobacteria bacterium]|nr:16S rRNA (uracil(1498)-N(3))-methyltransferase [Betaproteobacteria bacterium]